MLLYQLQARSFKLKPLDKSNYFKSLLPLETYFPQDMIKFALSYKVSGVKRPQQLLSIPLEGKILFFTLYQV